MSNRRSRSRRHSSARSRTTSPTSARHASSSAGSHRRRSPTASRARSRGSRNGAPRIRRRTDPSSGRATPARWSMASSSPPGPPPKRVLALFGPTASGKTAVAGILRDRLGADVVSADSAALYDGIPTLTAAPDYPAHLVGVVPLDEEVSVGRYQQLAHAAIDGAAAPLVV